MLRIMWYGEDAIFLNNRTFSTITYTRFLRTLSYSSPLSFIFVINYDPVINFRRLLIACQKKVDEEGGGEKRGKFEGILGATG